MTGEKDQWWGDERETAELIWCAAHLHRIIAPPSPKFVQQKEDLHPPDEGSLDKKPLKDTIKHTPPPTQEIESPTLIAIDPKDSERRSTDPKKIESSLNNRASPVRIPDPFPLPKPASISKMLLPLGKRVPGLLVNELDIDTIVEQTAEANGLPMMAFRPPLERWFEVHLLVDCSPSMAFWGDLAEGVATLFRWQGFFRDVRVWQFKTQNSEPRLFSGSERLEREIRSLIAPRRNRLFVVLTDTLGKAWYSGAAFATLGVLGEQHPVAIAHVFPQSLWQRTALHQAIQKPLVAPQSGCANSMLKVGARLHTTVNLYRFPIFNLSPNHFATWANFLAGSGGNSIQGVLIRQEVQDVAEVDNSKPVEDKLELDEKTPEYLLREFLSNASPKARELAEVLAAVPLIPPVMRLAQQQFLRDSEHWHLAEVFFSGLLQKSPLGPKEATVPETWYEFRGGIRELLLENSPALRTTEIWREIGDFIQHHYGSPRDFQALIPNPEGSIQDTDVDRDLYFAEVNAAVLMTWGGEYARQAQELRNKVAARKREKQASSETGNKTLSPIESLPLRQIFEFELATILIDDTVTPTQEKRIALISVEGDPGSNNIGVGETAGQDIYVRHIGEALAQLGWQVDMFTRKVSLEQDLIVQHSDNCRTIRLKAGPLEFVPRDEIFEYLPEFVDNFLKFQVKNEITYQLVHTNYWLSSWVGMQLNNIQQSKQVHTYHSLGAIEYNTIEDIPLIASQRLAVEKQVLEKAERIVATSPQEQQHMRSLVSTKGNIDIIPCGTDIQRFGSIAREAARAELGIDKEAKVVLYVGRFDQRKGIETLVRAVNESELRDSKNLKLIIGGGNTPGNSDGIERDRIEQIVNELGMSDFTTFAGRLSQDILPTYYAAADVCVVPSHYEPFGLVAIEAMASGTPVVASDVGGLQFTVIPEETGLLAPPQDVTAFATAIDRILLNPEWRDELGKTGRKRVISKFSWDVTADQLSKLYTQVLQPINRTQKTAQYYVEDLGNGITLDMVVIPGGSFMMGSPEDELERRDSESPQHSVTIQQFCIGKYPITQAQWKAVAALPQVNIELEADPSNFKGEQRPVEQVSWYDAVEFCDRLSQHTKRQYRLPSEAEWEYACRAGTTTPFHFGETITSELANYDATQVYGRGVEGTYREETTPLGSFNAANTFGLYDMHGNVWEWCLDDWHDNYEEAPTDGSPWFDIKNDNLSKKQGNAGLRGGSWFFNPGNCRSAYRRNSYMRDSLDNDIGFRVACDVSVVISQDDLSSEIDVDYTKLRDLLKAGKWREADSETNLVMLQAVGKDEHDLLDSEDLFNFPCTDLRTIDRLWVKYSNGRFGFSVQKNIYLEVTGKLDSYDPVAWDSFCVRIGWRVNRNWIMSSNITFDTSAPKGHLPLVWVWLPVASSEATAMRLSVFSCMETCKV
ncbi:SUMF1/EgtB/PvdO family nonheme iron enzyme [Nostoc sp. FACHB-973]|nr:SUMF1/EgtB/PvdO family nonheme iron enzyme [Nostoc sp. FACHB-973]